jgi:hypothetical protein
MHNIRIRIWLLSLPFTCVQVMAVFQHRAIKTQLMFHEIIASVLQLDSIDHLRLSEHLLRLSRALEVFPPKKNLLHSPFTFRVVFKRRIYVSDDRPLAEGK